MIITANELVNTLQKKGFVAYFAGGAVRDILLGIPAKDIDIVTSARPEEIEKIFPKTYPIGREFGIIQVKKDGEEFEVATFRTEGPYQDKRRPQWIKFSSEAADAKRRDFTINGLFYDPIRKKIIDYVGGQEDLKKRMIRFIGDANQRINEDNLRLLRAIRFKITLNFQYAPNTFQTILKHSSLIKNVTPERIRDEFNTILLSPRRHIGLTELVQSKITDYILPEINSLKGVPQPPEYHHEGDVFTHTYLAIKSLPKDSPLHLVWAVLLHDIAKPTTLQKDKGRIIFHNHAEESANLAEKILKRLKFSNIEIRTICYLIDNHMKIALIDKMRPTKRLALLTDPRFPDLIKLCEADCKGTYPINLSLVKKLEADLEKAKSERKRIELVRNKTKLFTGDNLIMLGYNPSKKFQVILDKTNDLILSGEIKTTDEAKKYVMKHYEN